MTTLTCTDLRYAVSARPIIHGISLTLRPGGLIALVGPNGAGKSTLLKGLGGILGGATGRVELDGVSVPELKNPQRARRLGYLPQTRPLAWRVSVGDVVSLGRFAYGSSLGKLSNEDRQATDRILRMCGVYDLKDQAADTLSGGESARMHFARVLNANTDILLTDEPCASLDPYHQHAIMGLLAAQAGTGKLVVTTLHDLDLAWRYASRIIVMQNGAVVADGAPKETLTPELIGDIYGVSASVHEDGLILTPSCAPEGR